MKDRNLFVRPRLDFGDFLNKSTRLICIYFRLWPQRGHTYQPRAEPVPTGVALGLTVLMKSALKGRHIMAKSIP
jgi:hypothetical protein